MIQSVYVIKEYTTLLQLHKQQMLGVTSIHDSGWFCRCMFFASVPVCSAASIVYKLLIGISSFCWTGTDWSCCTQSCWTKKLMGTFENWLARFQNDSLRNSAAGKVTEAIHSMSIWCQYLVQGLGQVMGWGNDSQILPLLVGHNENIPRQLIQTLWWSQIVKYWCFWSAAGWT